MNSDNQHGLLRATGIVVVIVTALILVALFNPVRRALLREIDQRFELEAQLIQSTVSAHLDQAVQLASQIPSRTQIRREMARYVRGEISPEEYRAFAEPRLSDAVRAAEEIVAVTRVDRTRTPVAIVGDPLPVSQSLQFNPSSGTVGAAAVYTDSIAAYVVTVPIRDPLEGLLGYDLVGISLVSLQAQLSRATRLFEATTARISAGNDVIARAGTGSSAAFDPATSRFATVQYRVTSQWELTVGRSRKTLYAPAETFVQQMAIAVIVVAAVMLVVVHRSVVALRERSRSEQLEREAANRRLLLREVHHRVKNDLSIIGSLLSLQEHSSSEPAVQQALSDAENRVYIVSHIYDQLYRTEDVGRVRIRDVFETFTQQFTEVELTLVVEDLQLDRKVATPIGIMVNELVVNAVKYGRPRTGQPAIEVRLYQDSDSVLHITVTDNGPGFPSHNPAEFAGFGLSTVETLGSQFDGTVTIPQTDSGGAVEVTLRVGERFSS